MALSRCRANDNLNQIPDFRGNRVTTLKKSVTECPLWWLWESGSRASFVGFQAVGKSFCRLFRGAAFLQPSRSANLLASGVGRRLGRAQIFLQLAIVAVG